MGFWSIIGRVGIDTSDLETGLKRSESMVTGWGNRIAGITKKKLAAAFGAAAIYKLTEDSIKAGAAIADTASKYDMSTKAIQELGYAAKMSGSSLEEWLPIFRKIELARKAALTDPEGKQAQDFAGVFKITAQDLKTSSGLDLFLKMTDQIKESRGAMNDLSAATDIFGKGALDSFVAARDGIRDLMTEADKYAVISDEIIKKQKALDDIETRRKAARAKALAEPLTMVGSIINFSQNLGSILAAGAAAQLKAHAEGKGIVGGIVEMFRAEKSAFQDIRNAEADPSKYSGSEMRDWKEVKEPIDYSEGVTPKAPDAPIRSNFKRAYEADSLVKIGAFGHVIPMVNEAKETNKELKKAVQLLGGIKSNTETMAQGEF